MNVKRIINKLGGSAETARMFEISSQAVSKWIRLNKIPKARLQYLKLARSDLFRR